MYKTYGRYMKPQLVLIRGLPGSGKSTLAREYAAKGYVHVEADDYFVGADGVYRFNPSGLPEAHAQCLSRAAAALKAGRDCVVANTFSRRWEMSPYIDVANSLGAEVTEITCTGNWPNVHDVPESTIARMRARWEE